VIYRNILTETQGIHYKINKLNILLYTNIQYTNTIQKDTLGWYS